MDNVSRRLTVLAPLVCPAVGEHGAEQHGADPHRAAVRAPAQAHRALLPPPLREPKVKDRWLLSSRFVYPTGTTHFGTYIHSFIMSTLRQTRKEAKDLEPILCVASINLWSDNK